MESLTHDLRQKFTKLGSDDSGPWRITFDTNPDNCNMYCIMCEEHSEFSPLRRDRISSGRPPRIMDISIIRKTVEEMKPFGLKEIIPSTMGEPLLYDDFLEILNICRKNGVKLNLTTNGTWPKFGATEWGKLICPVAKDIKISWNGATEITQESIMKGSSFHRRLKDLRDLISARNIIATNGGNYCSITLQCTFMENNILELPELVKMGINLGIDRIKGHHLWTHFPEIKALDLRRSADSIRQWNDTVDKCEEIASRVKRPDGSSIVLDNFLRLDDKLAETMPVEWQCPFLGKEAWVNHEGRFDPCCAPDAERRKLGYFGNVNDNGMKHIWMGENYGKLRENYMQNHVCMGCNMRRPSSG